MIAARPASPRRRRKAWRQQVPEADRMPGGDITLPGLGMGGGKAVGQVDTDGAGRDVGGARRQRGQDVVWAECDGLDGRIVGRHRHHDGVLAGFGGGVGDLCPLGNYGSALTGERL